MIKSTLRVAIVHRYFWPQNYPYAIMLKDIAESITGVGSKVSVYTSSVGDKEEANKRDDWQRKTNVKVFSTHLSSERQVTTVRKAFNAVWFGLWLTLKLLLSKHDVVMVATTPPVIIAFLVTLLSKIKGFRVIYHCQDIHPEALVVNGSISCSFLSKLLIVMDKTTVKNAWKVIVLSQDMKTSLIRRGLGGENIHIINNFIFHKLINDVGIDDEAKNHPGKVRFIFAGSLGRFQNLECLLEGIAKHKNSQDIEFLFLGDGPLKNKIKAFVVREELSNVLFNSQAPIDEALAIMKQFDAGIVSISEGVSKVAYPSKSIMYMSVGLPIFAVLETDSELATMLNKEGVGVAVIPKPEVIASGIRLMADSLKNGFFSTEKIRNYAESEFGKDVILNRIVDLVMDEV